MQTDPSLYFYEESAYMAYARPVGGLLSDQDLALQVSAKLSPSVP